MLVNFLVETAAAHADKNGFGFKQIIKSKRTWVLSGVKLRIDKLPKYLDEITLKTWVRGTERIFFERHFELLDKNNNKIGAAITHWVSIDLESRRPVAANKVDHQLDFYPDMYAMPDKLERIAELTEPKELATKTSKFSDLDLNKHVTTVRYIDWLVDEYPFEFLNTHVPKQFEITFLKEVLYGQQVRVLTQQQHTNSYSHSLVRKDDQKEVTRAKIEWVKIS